MAPQAVDGLVVIQAIGGSGSLEVGVDLAAEQIPDRRPLLAMLAAAAMAFSSVSVVLNSLRLSGK